MQVFKNPNFKFMKYKVLAFSVSGIIILAGLYNIIIRKGLNFGIDFAGGTLTQIIFKSPRPINDIRTSLSEGGLSSNKIQSIGNEGREFIIRTLPTEEEIEKELEVHEIIGAKVISILKSEEDNQALNRGLKDLNNIDSKGLSSLLEASFPQEATSIAENIINLRKNPTTTKGIFQNFEQLREHGISQDVIDVLKEKTFLGSLAVKRKETVGPQVGHDLRRKATQATVWALIGMLIYIGIRFKFAYGVSAILTLTHDVLITMGIFSYTGRELNLPVIAAILTIVGYSLNDTIVIFDRVRDNLKTLRKQSFESILDSSINQTLSRTIITSGTTFLTVFALFVFGGAVINDFAFVMLIGVITGTYSSIYQSCPLLYFWNKIFKPKKGMRK
ncbi:MAG: protein translocase subunit SecF [Candidatus Aminicenantes bacterium]|nr:protein translocase subunit SecF [Candidatus Aminicenantes bacterium]